MLTFAAVVSSAGCASDQVSPSDTSFLAADIGGSIQSRYEGSGSFRVLPAAATGARFALSSQGTGASDKQGFSFLALEPPAVGEHPVGDFDLRTFRVTYWADQGGVRRIYEAQTGLVRITASDVRRVSGSFSIRASLALRCILRPAFPSPILDCESTPGTEEVEITGSFVTGPVGGVLPGLTPSP
ncbi:hypothetical protein BH23GEM6_BH23GEM6_22320 [soil metagenome]